MKEFERVIYIALVICAIIFGLTREPGTNIKVVEVPGDSVFTEILIDNPIPYDTIIYDTDTLWLAADTVKITDTVFVYNDYFKMYSYNDTIKDDSSMTIVRDLKITQNKLYQEKYYTKNNRKTELIMTKDNSLGIGMLIGANLTAPMASYEFGNHQIGAGYNFNNPGAVVMYQYKFSLKNK